MKRFKLNKAAAAMTAAVLGLMALVLMFIYLMATYGGVESALVFLFVFYGVAAYQYFCTVLKKQ